MKFGKTYLETSAKFPPEWQKSSIEYRKVSSPISSLVFGVL